MSPFLPRDVLQAQLASPDVRSHYESVVIEAMRLVWRRRWLVACIVLGVMAVAVTATLLLPKKYTADALIQIDVGRRDQSLTGERATNLTLDAAAIVESEARIIRSRAIARRVVERLNLAADPEFAQGSGSFSVGQWLRAAAIWFDTAIAEWRIPPFNPAILAERGAALSANDMIVLSLLNRLSVEHDNRSYLIAIGFTSTSSETSARIANAFAEEYLQSRMEASLGAAESASAWLAGQLAEAREALRVTEQSLQVQRERTGIAEAGADGGTMLQQQLRELTAQLSAAVAARQADEARLRRAQEVIGNGARPLTTDVAAYPSLQRLMDAEAQAVRELDDLASRYGERHPQMRRARASLEDIRTRLASEVRNAVTAFETQVKAARDNERALEERIAALQQARIAAKRGEAEIKDLQTSADRIRERLRSLSNAYEQAVALQDLKPLNAQIVVRAEPVPVPSAPKPHLILGLAGLGALAGAIFLAILLERRDVGFRTTEEVRAATDTRCLGMVPELPPREAKRPDAPPTPPGPIEAMFREAIGAIGAVIGPTPSVTDKVVLVTSSVPGEGKSVLVSALAHSLIARGLRVLVIDDEPRHATGTAPATSYPLENVFADDDGGRSFFVSRAGERLCILDRATGPRNSVKLFNSRAFEAMLNEARNRYDVILIEGPPVMLLADSFVLGRHADTVIHVARWHSTARKTVLAALRRLKEMFIRVDGIVIVRVDMKLHQKYSFVDECSFFQDYRQFYQSYYK